MIKQNEPILWIEALQMLIVDTNAYWQYKEGTTKREYTWYSYQHAKIFLA